MKVTLSAQQNHGCRVGDSLGQTWGWKTRRDWARQSSESAACGSVLESERSTWSFGLESFNRAWLLGLEVELFRCFGVQSGNT